MPKIKAIILEDEGPAQELLKSYVTKTDWISLEGIVGDAMEALEFLKKQDVDLIFLDIQIPGITGLEFLRSLDQPPQIIITTAYSQHAVEAFELDVRDYLMKPFSFERYLKAVGRISLNPEPAQVHQLQNVQTEKSFAFFNVNKTMVKVRFGDIQYIESMREYIYIYTTASRVVTKIGIGEIEQLLGAGFLRIHRSFLVNVDKIETFNAEEITIAGKSLPIGANYKKGVEECLGPFITRSSN